MVSVREIPLWLFIMFTFVYSLFGDPDSQIWSGLFFFVHYGTLLILFKGHKSKTIRLTGISLSLAIIVFVALKYILKLEVDRIYTIVPFLISLFGLIALERKKYASNNRKGI